MIISLFLVAQFAGILLAYVSFPPSSIATLIQPAVQSAQLNSTSFILILGAEIVVIAIVLMCVKNFYKGKNVFGLLEAYIIVFGGFFFFLFVIGDIFYWLSLTTLSIIALICALALFFAKKKKFGTSSTFRNIVTLISSIGAGVFIGVGLGAQMGVLALYAVLFLFAVYDYLAVFVLKFMIPLAKQAVNMNLAMMIGSAEIELRPKSGGKKGYTNDELANINSSKVREMIKQGNMPSVSSIMLGNGDLMLPLAVAAGAYIYTSNLSIAIVISLGAAVGLMFTFSVLRKYKVGLPAIPPIFAFISLALAAYSVVTGIFSIYIEAIFVIAAVFWLGLLEYTLKRQAIKASGNKGK